MRSVGNVILVLLVLLVTLGSGCRRSADAPARQRVRLVRAAPTWGPEAEGVQCRLRSVKRLWTADESITFKLDLRNQGRRLFAFNAAQPIRTDRILWDGRWYRVPRPDTAPAKVRPLAPGSELTDLTLIVPRMARLPLTPGYHEVAVAFIFEGIEVVSNSVGIEIAPIPTPQ